MGFFSWRNRGLATKLLLSGLLLSLLPIGVASLFQDLARECWEFSPELARGLLRRDYRVQPEDLEEVRSSFLKRNAKGRYVFEGRSLALVYAMAELREPDFDRYLGDRSGQIDYQGVLLNLFAIRDGVPHYAHFENFFGLANNFLNGAGFRPFVEVLLSALSFYVQWGQMIGTKPGYLLESRIRDFRMAREHQSNELDEMISGLFPGLLAHPRVHVD